MIPWTTVSLVKMLRYVSYLTPFTLGIAGVPDFNTIEGRRIIFAVGAIAVFFNTIDPRCYKKNSGKDREKPAEEDDVEEEDVEEEDANEEEEGEDGEGEDGEEAEEEEAAEEEEEEAAEEEDEEEDEEDEAVKTARENGRSEEEEVRLARAREAFMQILFRIAHAGWYKKDTVPSTIEKRWYLPYCAVLHIGAMMLIIRRRLHVRMPQHTKERTSKAIEANLIRDISAFVAPSIVKEFKEMLRDYKKGQPLLEDGFYMIGLKEEDDFVEKGVSEGDDIFKDEEFEAWISETPSQLKEIFPMKGTPGVYGQMRPPNSLRKVVKVCEYRETKKREREEDSSDAEGEQTVRRASKKVKS